MTNLCGDEPVLKTGSTPTNPPNTSNTVQTPGSNQSQTTTQNQPPATQNTKPVTTPDNNIKTPDKDTKKPDTTKPASKFEDTSKKMESDDFEKIFLDDLKGVLQLDGKLEKQLSLLLERASTDPIALDFIFNQALDGNLISLLQGTQADIDKKLAEYKAEEVFTPVKIDTAGMDVDLIKSMSKQEKVKEANAAINDIFSKVENNMANKTAIPSINYGVPGQTSISPKPTTADLPRVVSDIKIDSTGKPIPKDLTKIVNVGSPM